MRSRAASGGSKLSLRPSRIAAISSSFKPYILPPAEFASIQKGQPTHTAVRSVKTICCRWGTADFCPSSHSPTASNQNTRGTRAEIFCGVRSRPNILRTFLNTWRIRNDVCWGSTPSILAISFTSLSSCRRLVPARWYMPSSLSACLMLQKRTDRFQNSRCFAAIRSERKITVWTN